MRDPGDWNFRESRSVTGILGPAALGSQNWGMHPEPRQQSWHSRGEKYVLAGGAGQNMISFSFPACGRGNSARRALPGEGRWTERWVRAFGFFAGCRPDLLALPGESIGRLGAWEPMGFCGLLPGPAAFPGQAMGRKGGWIPLRRRPKLEDSRTNTQGDERERAGALSLLPGNGGGPRPPSAWGPVGGALAPVRVR